VWEFIILEPSPPSLPPPHNHYTQVQKEFGIVTPDSKIVLEEIQCLFAKPNTKLDQRFIESALNFDRRIMDSELSQDVCVTTLEKAARYLNLWCQQMEGVVDNLLVKVGKLSKHWD
jgi:hypothetical protein